LTDTGRWNPPPASAWWLVGVAAAAFFGQMLWVGNQVGEIHTTVDGNLRRIEQLEHVGSPALMAQIAAIRVQTDANQRWLTELAGQWSTRLPAMIEAGVSHAERIAENARLIETLQRQLDQVREAQTATAQRLTTMEAQEAAPHPVPRKDSGLNKP